jgi:hypothetical protein
VADMLASEVDLATWLQQDVDTASATLAIELATGAIQDECGWRILTETVTGLLVAPHANMVTLPTMRLTALAMTDNGQPLVQGSTMLWSTNGLVLRKAFNGLADYPFIGPVLATFTHGYPADSIPQTIRGVCVLIASRVYDNPTGLRSEGIGSSQEVKSPGGANSFMGATLTDEERRTLGPYTVQPVAIST